MLATALASLATYIRHHLHEISFGITAVSLMLAGPHVNGTIRRCIKKLHWIARYAVFVLLCTVGYMFLAHILYEGVRNVLGGCSDTMLVALTLGMYLLLAWIAKEQRMI